MLQQISIFVSLMVFLLIANIAYTEVQGDCPVGDFSKGRWEYVYPDDPGKAVCTFPGTITSYTAPFIEGGGYRGYLILRSHKCGEAFECKNNNFIYEPQGPVGNPCSLERYCLDGFVQETKFSGGYCYYPTGRQPPNDYECFVGGGQVVGDLQEWKCNPPPPEPHIEIKGFGPPLCPI